MGIPKTGNSAFDNAAAAADNARQVAQTGVTSQSSVRSADVAYYQSLLAAATAAGQAALMAEFAQTLATLRYAST